MVTQRPLRSPLRRPRTMKVLGFGLGYPLTYNAL